MERLALLCYGTKGPKSIGLLIQVQSNCGAVHRPYAIANWTYNRTMKNFDVVIVGAGIIGCSLARSLASKLLQLADGQQWHRL